MAEIIEDKPEIGKPEKYNEDTELIGNLLDKTAPIPGKTDKKEREEEPESEPEDLIVDDDKEEDKDKIEPEEEELDVQSNRGVDFKKIKTKFEDFSKTNEFRELRNAYYREAQYTELFPTVEDAAEAHEDKQTYDKLNDSIVNYGDSSVLISAIKDASPEALQRFSSGFLGELAKVDTNLYVSAISPVVKNLARQMNLQGRKLLQKNPDSDDGRSLVATARNIMQYAFEDADLVDRPDQSEQRNPQVDAREQELNQREIGLRQQQFNQAFSVVANSAEKHLDRIVTEGLDPDGRFNDFTSSTLLEKIKNEVKSQLNSDQSHLRRMNSLWSRAEREGYSRESLSRIVSAYLERARPVISQSRTKYRGIALKGKAERNTDESIKIGQKGTSGRTPTRVSDIRRVDTKKLDYKNMSDDDIFEGKLKYK